MSSYEYKTVALPRAVTSRPRRRQSEEDLVAEQLGKVLNEEAVDRWEYLRAETLTTPGYKGMFQKTGPSAYVVLIFRREQAAEAAQPEKSDTKQMVREEPSTEPSPPPAAQTAPAAGSAPPELRIASTGGQVAARQEPSVSGDGTPATPRQPLGPASE